MTTKPLTMADAVHVQAYDGLKALTTTYNLGSDGFHQIFLKIETQRKTRAIDLTAVAYLITQPNDEEIYKPIKKLSSWHSVPRATEKEAERIHREFLELDTTQELIANLRAMATKLEPDTGSSTSS